jgi:hypothetical protein
MTSRKPSSIKGFALGRERVPAARLKGEQRPRKLLGLHTSERTLFEAIRERGGKGLCEFEKARRAGSMIAPHDGARRWRKAALTPSSVRVIN